MSAIYTTGEYKKNNPNWHAEDSSWKAKQIFDILLKSKIAYKNICEIGCGAGLILNQLSKLAVDKDVSYCGYDISPQAIELARHVEDENIHFFNADLLNIEYKDKYFDILLVIDVFEHVPDYMGFLEKCKNKATYKIYHIPLDIHASSVIRNAFIKNRKEIGHIHYFTAESAIETLLDTGHEIIDFCYTNAAIDLFKQHPSVKKAIANIPRMFLSKFNLPLTARLFGGYSLLVLTK